LKEKVFITGANGFIGSNLCRWLLDRGYEVHGLVRRTSDLHFLDGLAVKLVHGDLREPQSFDLPQGLDSVVHAASVVSDQASEPECDAGIYGTTVNLVRKVLDGGSPLKRFVYVSTTLVLGYMGTNLSEENPGRPTDFMPYSRAKKKTEAYLREKMKSAGLPLVIVRPGDTYGPNDRTTCARVIGGIEKGIPVIVGRGRCRFASCYIDNLCQAVELTLKNDRSVGQAFTVTNGVLPTWREFFGGLQRGVGKKQRIYVPVFLGKVLAACDQLRKKLQPGYYAELSQYRIRRITTETTYDISRTVDELGYCPDNDTERQIRAIVDWYLEEKKKGHIR
jgi:nucleoside-diphosphate-sugar epimerase